MNAPQTIDVWTLAHDQDAALVSACEKVLSAEEIARLYRFKPEHKRREFALSRAMLRGVLGEMLEARPVDLEFAYGNKGKPALGGKFVDASVSFNLSHSGGMTVLAVTRCEADLGVDIERLRADVDCIGLASRFFSSSESRELADIPASARPAAFFACWTRKEALVKSLGMGIVFGLAEFSVSMDPAESEARLASDHPALAGAWRIYSISPEPGYLAAVAVGDPGDHTIRQHDAAPLLRRAVGK
ncbi:MAG: 4'-phosphopantetheinyl transferase superfamily protein [Gammaproteobacteria bacterium]|jgi:4'-phosphopantetheinyl transferase|nr:MAG: 4'-phosphopantetheinyl transferase superfamily protein [Gammaproteobacteria bacterium]